MESGARSGDSQSDERGVRGPGCREGDDARAPRAVRERETCYGTDDVRRPRCRSVDVGDDGTSDMGSTQNVVQENIVMHACVPIVPLENVLIQMNYENEWNDVSGRESTFWADIRD